MCPPYGLDPMACVPFIAKGVTSKGCKSTPISPLMVRTIIKCFLNQCLRVMEDCFKDIDKVDTVVNYHHSGQSINKSVQTIIITSFFGMKIFIPNWICNGTICTGSQVHKMLQSVGYGGQSNVTQGKSSSLETYTVLQVESGVTQTQCLISFLNGFMMEITQILVEYMWLPVFSTFTMYHCLNKNHGGSV